MTEYAKCTVCGYTVAIPDDADPEDYLCPVDGSVLVAATEAEHEHVLFRQEATFIVAASNSLHKERADYVCDGTDDQVEIQAAIDNASKGGVVLLMEGNFYLGAPINLNKDAVSLVGVQAGVTSAGGTTIYQTNAGMDAIVVDAFYAHVKNIYIRGALSGGSHAGGTGIHIISGQDNKIDNVNVAYFVSYGVFFDNVNNMWLTNSRILDCLGKNLALDHCHDMVIVGNQLEGAHTTVSAFIGYCYSCSIVGNLIEYSSSITLHVHYCIRCSISGNNINGTSGQDYTLYLEAGSENIIVGNEIGESHDGEAVRFQATTSDTFVGNILTGTPAGEEDIYVRNNCVGNIIMGNECYSSTADYSIRLHYTGNKNNIIYGNYCAAPVTDTSGQFNIIRNNVGYPTDSFKTTSQSVTVGTGATYGAATNITSLSGIITYPRVKVTWGGTFAAGETVTVKVQAHYDDDTTAYVEKSRTDTDGVGSTWLDDDDIMSLVTQGRDIIKLEIYAKSDQASTSVTVTVDAFGKA